MLLDEPTNHLDEQSVEWLGDWLISNNPMKPAVKEIYDVAEPEE